MYSIFIHVRITEYSISIEIMQKHLVIIFSDFVSELVAGELAQRRSAAQPRVSDVIRNMRDWD